MSGQILPRDRADDDGGGGVRTDGRCERLTRLNSFKRVYLFIDFNIKTPRGRVLKTAIINTTVYRLRTHDI